MAVVCVRFSIAQMRETRVRAPAQAKPLRQHKTHRQISLRLLLTSTVCRDLFVVGWFNETCGHFFDIVFIEYRVFKNALRQYHHQHHHHRNPADRNRDYYGRAKRRMLWGWFNRATLTTHANLVCAHRAYATITYDPIK